MFEQQSYDKATVTVESLAQQPPLFKNYEIKPWGFSPIIYKVLGVSALINLAFLAVVSQTNVLTARGCDSPWVGRVCQVVDMAYVGAMIFGTEREYIDEAYENIDLGEADITFIDVTGETPPISYPEGYFQVANPEQHQMRLQMQQNPDGTVSTYQPSYTPSYTPTVPNNDADLTKIRPNPPVSRPGLLEDDSASTTPPSSGIASSRKGRGGRIRPESNTNTAIPDEKAIAEANTNTQPKATPTDPVTGPDINKRPIVDLGNFVNEKLQKNEVDLQTQFIVSAKGKLDKNGRLDPKTFKYEQAVSTDEDMVEVVQRAVEAINVAGYLQYLKDMSGKDFNFQLQQDLDNISATAMSEMESESRAKAIKGGLDLLIMGLKLKKQGENADQNDKDDLLLLENATVETNGKQVVLKFVVPKAIAHPMIQRKLAEQAAENQKPSGLAPSKSDNNTAIK